VTLSYHCISTLAKPHPLPQDAPSASEIFSTTTNSSSHPASPSVEASLINCRCWRHVLLMKSSGIGLMHNGCIHQVIEICYIQDWISIGGIVPFNMDIYRLICLNASSFKLVSMFKRAIESSLFNRPCNKLPAVCRNCRILNPNQAFFRLFQPYFRIKPDQQQKCQNR